jgi:hypothetical protein
MMHILNRRKSSRDAINQNFLNVYVQKKTIKASYRKGEIESMYRLFAQLGRYHIKILFG